MIRCPKCDREIDPQTSPKVCVYCGAALELDEQATIDNIGDATIELPAPLDVPSDSGDPNATIDLTGEATMELPAADTPQPKSPTTPLSADATLDFGSQDDNAISISWGEASKTARVDQTIQIGGTVSGFRSSLPIKSRALRSQIDKQPGSAVLGGPGDAPDYEILNLLGQGGMGVVYTAKQSSIARTVAVKMLKPGDKEGSGSHGSEDQRDKFISEAVITGELEHPNIVPIYDLGANDEGALFYSMKRVKGTPWDEVIEEKSLSENLSILMRVADAVAFAHANGVIHRDLKPENVMLGDYGEVLVMDWGLARVTPEFPSAESVYQSASLGGTPAYMAPEMTVGPIEKIDERSDIYLLGAILYEITGGKPPHTGKDAMACLMAASKNDIRPTEYQGELLTTALRAMQTKPADRYQTVKEFQQAVQEYLAHAESVLLSENATRHLEQASETNDYELFSKAMFGFEEALGLWSENSSAHAGRGEARLAYARTAKDKGDLDLGLSLLETPIDDRSEEQTALVEELRLAQAERKARQARLRNVKRLAIALVLTIIAGGAYSYYEISKQKNEAVRQRGFAEEQREIALKNEKRAVENEEIANTKREEAEVAQAEEARQREIADTERIRAETNEQEAIVARDEARAAQAKEEEAKKQEAVARAAAEYEGYVARIGLASEKIEENAFREALALLDACPPEMRQWEWGRLRYLCDLSEQVFDLGAPIDAIAYSPDGELLVSGDWNGRVTLRNASGGEPLWVAKVGQYVHAVAFSPDGSLVATGASDGVVLLLNAQTGQPKAKLVGHEQGVLDVNFSPDGKTLISCGYDQTARLWDVATGTEQQTLQGHSWWVWSAAFSEDGEFVVTAGQDGRAIVWRRSESGFQKLTEFTGHEGPVYDAAFSPDGMRVASCGYDHTICLWDAEVGLPVDIEARLEGRPEPKRTDQRLTGHTGAIRSVAYSPEGRRLLSGGQDNTLRVWDLADGSSTVLRGHGGRIRSVAFAPNGQQALSGAHDNQVRLWNLGSYREQRVLRAEVLHGHRDAVLSARFSQDSNQIVTASRDRTARLWQVGSGVTLHEFSEGHAFLASSAVLFDNGKRLATSAGDNTTRIWDVASGVQRFVFEPTGRSAALAVAPQGDLIATGGPQGAVRWWDAIHGDMIAESTPDDESVTTLAFSPTAGLLASGDERGRIRLWRQDETGAWTESALLSGHSRSITSLRFTPNGKRLISSSGDRTCGQWDIENGKELRSLVLRHPEWVSALDLSQDGMYALTACDDGAVRMWRLADAKVIAQHQSNDVVFTDIDLSPDGSTVLLTAAGNRTVYQWDITANKLQPLNAINERGDLIWSARFGPRGQALVTVGGNDAQLWSLNPLQPAMRFSPHGAVADAALSPDGALLATGSWDATAKLWDANTGKAVRKLAGGHNGYVNSIDFSPNGAEVLTAGDDGLVRFWQANDGKLLDRTLTGHQGRILQAKYDSTGRRVLTASSDKTARVWDRQTGQPLVELRGHDWAVTSIAISPDGQSIVTGSDDNTAILWDAQTGASLFTLAGHTAGVTSVAISPDGSRILTGGQDGAIKLWDAATGKELLPLAGHRGEVTWVEFSPTGESALSAGRDGAIILWPTSDWEQTQKTPVAAR